MKIQYCSDLHLEFPENKIYLNKNPLPVIGDILVLAGDVVPFTLMDKYATFFSWASGHFEHTYWIPGNHEYYYSDIRNRSGAFSEKIKSNVTLLNNQVVHLENTRLLFSTLWSHISPLHHRVIQHGLSDFHEIRNGDNLFTPEQFNQFHQEALNFLFGELAIPYPGQSVVVTHHVPTLLNYPAQYKNSELNGAFVTELSDPIYDSGADYWIYGHHHQNTLEFKIGHTRLLTNQLGYVRYRENKGFEGGRCINLH